MNWVEDTYRPWFSEHGAEFDAPEAPSGADNEWGLGDYTEWYVTLPAERGDAGSGNNGPPPPPPPPSSGSGGGT